jgi:hypothetical protein
MEKELIPLRDICKELKIDPREARIKLRAGGKRAPNGSWKWPKAKVAEIKKILSAESKPATPKGKAKKPAAKKPAAKKSAKPAATEVKP